MIQGVQLSFPTLAENNLYKVPFLKLLGHHRSLETILSSSRVSKLRMLNLPISTALDNPTYLGFQKYCQQMTALLPLCQYPRPGGISIIHADKKLIDPSSKSLKEEFYNIFLAYEVRDYRRTIDWFFALNDTERKTFFDFRASLLMPIPEPLPPHEAPPVRRKRGKAQEAKLKDVVRTYQYNDFNENPPSTTPSFDRYRRISFDRSNQALQQFQESQAKASQFKTKTPTRRTPP